MAIVGASKSPRACSNRSREIMVLDAKQSSLRKPMHHPAQCFIEMKLKLSQVTFGAVIDAKTGSFKPCRADEP